MPSSSARSKGSPRSVNSFGGQRHERLLPDVEAVRALLQKVQLPLTVAQPREVAVVGQ